MRKSGRSKAEDTVAKVKPVDESENEEASGDDENSAFSKLKRGSKKASSLDEARNKRKRRDDGDHEESDDNRSEEIGNNSDDEEDKTSQSKKLKKTPTKGKKGVADSGDEENGHKSDEEEEKATNKKKKGAKGKKRATDSEDDEAGKNGEEEVSPSKKGKKVAKGKKRGASEDPADDVPDAKESDDEEIPLSKKMQAVKKNGMSKGKKRAAELEEKEEFEVESVVGSRLLRGKQQYRIRWRGFKAEDDTWEDEGGLDCIEAIKAYLDTCPEEEPVQGPRSGKKGNKKTKVKMEDQNTKDGNNSEEVSKEEYEVDRIVDIFIKKDGKREFLVHWKGYNSKDNTWEPEEHLNCPDLISKYLAKVEDAKSRNEKDLRVSRKPTDRFTLSMGGGGRRISRRGQGKQRARYDDAE